MHRNTQVQNIITKLPKGKRESNPHLRVVRYGHWW